MKSSIRIPFIRAIIPGFLYNGCTMTQYMIAIAGLIITSLAGLIGAHVIIRRTQNNIYYLPDDDVDSVNARLKILFVTVSSKCIFGLIEVILLLYFRNVLEDSFAFGSRLGIAAVISMVINCVTAVGTGIYIAKQLKDGVLDYPTGFSQTLSVSGFIELIPVASTAYFAFVLMDLI